MPRLLNLLDAKRLHGLFDIKTWLTPHINRIQHHSKPLHFKFSKGHSDNIVFQYKGRHNQPWTSADNTILDKIPNGKPKVLTPPNFSKIDFNNLEKNVDRAKFLFSDSSQLTWWKSFISNMLKIKQSPAKTMEYAKTEAQWTLPSLPKQSNRQDNAPSTSSAITPEVQNMLDQELQNPRVCICYCRVKEFR